MKIKGMTFIPHLIVYIFAGILFIVLLVFLLDKFGLIDIFNKGW